MVTHSMGTERIVLPQPVGCGPAEHRLGRRRIGARRRTTAPTGNLSALEIRTQGVSQRRSTVPLLVLERGLVQSCDVCEPSNSRMTTCPNRSLRMPESKPLLSRRRYESAPPHSLPSVRSMR